MRCDCLIARWGRYRLVQDDLLRFQVTQLRCGHLRTLESVVLEQAFLDSTIGELHAASTVLYTVAPLALVARPVFPVHLAIAVPLIVFIAPLVVVARLPSEETKAVLFVVLVAALVLVAVLVIESLLPLATSVLQAVFELTDVDAGVLPLVLALPLRFAVDVDTREHVSVRKEIRSLPMLQTVEPLSFESVTVFPGVDTISCGL